MPSHSLVALVTLAAILTYFWMGLRVPAARNKSGIQAPAMTGDPLLERTIRAHYNTLEWLPIFLPSMWLFAIYWNDRIAAAVGVIWIVGRHIYMVSYVKDPKTRSRGFGLQALATLLLFLIALIGAVINLIPQ